MKRITEYAIPRFKAHLIENEKSKNTVEKYIRDITFFISWLGIRDLSKESVLEYKQHLIKKYAPASVNSAISSLNAFFIYIKRPELHIKALKIQRCIFSEKSKELSKSDYDKLLIAAKRKKDPVLYYLLQTMCSTGIRVSELRYITADAIKKEKSTIICKGKIRTVLLPHKLCDLLKKYISKKQVKHGPIFVTKNGKPLDRSYIWRTLKGLCAEAGVSEEKVFPHNFRHLFARMFYLSCKDIVKLADILGHSNINTTRIYTAESGEAHRMHLQKLGLLKC